MSLPLTVLIALLITGTCLALFLAAVEMRLFSRWRRGFLITLMLATAGIGISSSVLIGIWGYESARAIMADQTVLSLGNLGRMIEGESRQDIDEILTEIHGLAEVVLREIGKAGSGRARQVLPDISSVDEGLLQLNLTDRRGDPLVELSSVEGCEPMTRVAAAFGLDGRRYVSDPFESHVFNTVVLRMTVPLRAPGGEIRGAAVALYDLQKVLTRLVTSARFGESGYSVVVGNDGRIIAHPDPRRLREDVTAYPSVHAALQGKHGWMIHTNRAGDTRLFFYRPLASPATVNPRPMVLLTEMDQSEADEPLRAMRRQFVLGTSLFGIVCLAIAWQIVHGLKKPLVSMLGFVGKVEEGDFTARLQSVGHDEIGRIGQSLNEMVRGLEERDQVKELFGRYVTTQVSEQVLKGDVDLGGQSRRVTILFSDIRDFTSMSEKMTPADVVSFLNEYFSEMVEAVFEQGGILDKFIGDGMMAVFGAFGDQPDHATRAVRAALRMKALLSKINGERAIHGREPIRIGIGVHTDEVIVGNIGSRRRLEYTVIGDGVNTGSRVEGLNKEFGTTILMTETTFAEVDGRFECRLMPEAHLKGKSRPLRFYEVLSARSA